MISEWEESFEMLHSTFELLIVERSHTYAKTITGYYTCAHLALLPSSSSISLTLPGPLMKMPHVTCHPSSS